MRIQGPRTDQITERPGQERAGAASRSAAGTEAVKVASATSELSGLAERGRASRAEKVAHIRGQVQSGKYVVDRQKLAERMVDDELARAGR
jgi:flagellar biosynthesis anti-sigma factor FlgM